jgi:hypothetical protein
MNSKGMVTYDYNEWSDLLKNKALTSLTVSKVINAYTNIKGEEKINTEFYHICTEIGLNSIQSKKLKRTFGRYRNSRISNNSTINIDTTKKIVELINHNIEIGVEDLNILIQNIISSIDSKMKKQFHSNDDLKGAIICEYIMMN